MKNVMIIEAIRTPFGRFGGALKDFSAVELGTQVVKAALARSGVAPSDIGETILGSALLVGATMVAARQVNHAAGIPLDVPSMTLDRACCSSMTAIGLGALKIAAGDTPSVLAGGIDSCSKTPFLMRNGRWGHRLGDFTVEDPMQFRNPITQRSIALVTGEAALRQGISREEQDDWACASHRRYFQAHESGVFKDELLSIEVHGRKVVTKVDIDESPRKDVSRERLSELPTVYGSPTITAGNAPGLNDGASIVLLMERAAAESRKAPVLGELVSYAQACGDLESSVYMPGVAIEYALAKAGVSVAELKRIEINEAFAAMPLASTKKLAGGDAKLLKTLRDMTNVNGGSVAIGHPPGASGARVVMALVRELRRIGGGYGAAAICGGFGQADAVIVKV